MGTSMHSQNYAQRKNFMQVIIHRNGSGRPIKLSTTKRTWQQFIHSRP